MTDYEQSIANERQTAIEFAQKVRYTFAEVATILGKGWALKSLEESEDIRTSVQLVNSQGFMIYGSWGYYRNNGKISISGSYNYGDRSLGLSFPHGKTQPSINVSLSRGAKVIAADMQRRFMPEFLAASQEIVERVKLHTDSRNNKRACIDRLALVAGTLEPRFITDAGFRSHNNSREYTQLLECKVWNYSENKGMTVQLEFDNLTEEQAKKLIAYAAIIRKEAIKCQ